MDILILKLLSESISDFGKVSNWKYANYANWLFLERFDHTKILLKNGFPILFSKSDLVGGGRFCDKKILKKLNTTEYAQVLVVTCPKPNSFAALLFPPYQYGTEV